MSIRKKIAKKVALVMVVVMTLSIIPVLDNITSKATETIDGSEVVETHTYIINGVTRTLYILDNTDIYLAVGDSTPIYINSDISYIALDMYGTVFAVRPRDHFIHWYSYDLQHEDAVFHPIIKSVSQNNAEYMNDVESLILDSDNKFIIGYKTFSGESYAIPTPEDMKKILSTDNYLEYPLPKPLVTPSPTEPTPTPGSTITPTPTPPQDPTPTPPTQTDTTIQNQQNTAKQPTVTQNSSTTSKSSSSKVSIKKKSGYTCLSVGNEIVSKYKLKKGVLTWKGAKKSKKVKQVKQVGFIKKSKNLIYITKKGKAYTISQKGKKKTIVKKDAKKLIFKNGYVIKIKKKSGYTNVVNK